MLNFVADVLMPPASLAVLAFLLFLGGAWCRRLGLLVMAVLIALGLPFVSAALLDSLAPPPAAPGPPPSAIVILSADGVPADSPLGLDPGLLSLDRLRAGAQLHRATGLPILVSGGQFLDYTATLSDMMALSLQQDFRVNARWQENQSQDTWGNAEFSAAILHQAGISRIYLVTNFWHMRRAMIAFRHFGMDPVPAPAHQVRPPRLDWTELLIAATAWLRSYYALHEWVGIAYYTLRQ